MNGKGKVVGQARIKPIFTNKVTLWRWRDEFQNDVAARMDWCIESFEEANHPPVPVLNHPDEITVRSGQVFSLNAIGSSDPDGDHIGYLWFHYPEACTYKTFIKLEGSENLSNVSVIAPEVEKKGNNTFYSKSFR